MQVSIRINSEGEFRFRGEKYVVQGRKRIGARDYLILKNLGAQGRSCSLAFDRTAGPDGDLRVIHELPKNAATRQQLSVLSRISRLNSSLPVLDNYHVGRDCIWVVRRWVRGVSLEEYLSGCRVGKRPWPSSYIALTKFRGFVHGLCQMHDRLRIVHGDICPDNIVVGSDPLSFVLVDFGNSWTEERGAIRAVGDGFHPGYAAPELCDQSITPTDLSDQFSATAVLFELLTGKLPFEGLGGKAGWPQFRSAFGKFVPTVRTEIEKRGDLPRHIIPAVEEVIGTGLQLDPERRFATGAVWRDAIDAIAHDMQTVTNIRGWKASWLDWLGRVGRRWKQNKATD